MARKKTDTDELSPRHSQTETPMSDDDNCIDLPEQVFATAPWEAPKKPELESDPRKVREMPMSDLHRFEDIKDVRDDNMKMVAAAWHRVCELRNANTADNHEEIMIAECRFRERLESALHFQAMFQASMGITNTAAIVIP